MLEERHFKVDFPSRRGKNLVFMLMLIRTELGSSSLPIVWIVWWGRCKSLWTEEGKATCEKRKRKRPLLISRLAMIRSVYGKNSSMFLASILGRLKAPAESLMGGSCCFAYGAQRGSGAIFTLRYSLRCYVLCMYVDFSHRTSLCRQPLREHVLSAAAERLPRVHQPQICMYGVL